MIAKHTLTTLTPPTRKRHPQKPPNANSADSSLGNAPYLSALKSIARRFSPSWLACIPLTAIIVVVWHLAVQAEETEAARTLKSVASSVAELQGTLNTIWVLIAAILVIFMNAGFAMLETGFCRQKNAVNILAKNLIVFALSSIAFWAIGFSLMFGSQGNSFVGLGGWFLGSEEPAIYGLKPFPEGLPISVFFLFQVAFAGTAATIVSGAVAERIKFVDFLVFSLIIVGIIYPISGHWIWGGGWLSELGFKDFAGSTAVHSVGGWAALTGAAILGPRIGKYSEGRINALPGHNMSIATLGCLILWIGWFGFNPGSALAANQDVPYIAVTTNLAAAAGGIAAALTAWIKDGKPDLSMIINGVLAGLVAITAGCDGVSYWSSVIIGLIAGVVVVYSVAFFDRIHIDDPVGATSVHLVCGIWGTLAVGIFNKEAGAIAGQGQLLVNQILGIVAVGAFVVVLSAIAWLVLKAILGIRVSPEEEIYGLDIGEHGMEAYSGFVKEADVLFGSRAVSMSGTDSASRSEMP
jgi:Amt family ammonium transporter